MAKKRPANRALKGVAKASAAIKLELPGATELRQYRQQIIEYIIDIRKSIKSVLGVIDKWFSHGAPSGPDSQQAAHSHLRTSVYALDMDVQVIPRSQSTDGTLYECPETSDGPIVDRENRDDFVRAMESLRSLVQEMCLKSGAINEIPQEWTLTLNLCLALLAFAGPPEADEPSESEKLFDCFDLFHRGMLLGWECSIKADVDPRLVVAASTKIAKYAVFLMGEALHGDHHEPDEWFDKAAEALRTVTNDHLIGNALCEAQIEESNSAGESAVIRFCGIEAASWHGWVWDALWQVTKRESLDRFVWIRPESFDGIGPRLQIESVRAQKILSAHSTDEPTEAPPATGSGLNAFKTSVRKHGIEHVNNAIADTMRSMGPELRDETSLKLSPADLMVYQWNVALPNWLESQGLPRDPTLAAQVALQEWGEFAFPEDVQDIPLDNFVQLIKIAVAKNQWKAPVERSKQRTIADEAAPKGTPGRKPDELKTQHARRANELRSMKPQKSWKACADAVNMEFNLIGADRYTNVTIRDLHRVKCGDKAQKKKRD